VQLGLREGSNLAKKTPRNANSWFNGRVERKRAGIIILMIKNGYHSQKGVKFYHLLFSRDEIDLNQLSFGISGGLIQSQLDETS
jgi:hypothetical protein